MGMDMERSKKTRSPQAVFVDHHHKEKRPALQCRDLQNPASNKSRRKLKIRRAIEVITDRLTLADNEGY
jgi:hypothetical protein